MVAGAEWDNNILAFIDYHYFSNSNANVNFLPKDHMTSFSERIINLMKEVGKWYGNDDDDDDGSAS